MMLWQDNVRTEQAEKYSYARNKPAFGHAFVPIQDDLADANEDDSNPYAGFSGRSSAHLSDGQDAQRRRNPPKPETALPPHCPYLQEAACQRICQGTAVLGH